MTAPIKTCDYCGATGEMPTFMNGETICYTCMSVLPKTLPEARQELMRLRAVLAVGAQPAPSVPDATWLPVPDKHPTFDPVDLQLADGSVLCGCVPQSDGDYWWEGPSGEVFIDPRYAPVTHWRLSAAPEAKEIQL